MFSKFDPLLERSSTRTVQIRDLHKTFRSSSNARCQKSYLLVLWKASTTKYQKTLKFGMILYRAQTSLSTRHTGIRGRPLRFDGAPFLQASPSSSHLQNLCAVDPAIVNFCSPRCSARLRFLHLKFRSAHSLSTRFGRPLTFGPLTFGPSIRKSVQKFDQRHHSGPRLNSTSGLACFPLSVWRLRSSLPFVHCTCRINTLAWCF